MARICKLVSCVLLCLLYHSTIAVRGNILDVTCVNLNPFYEPANDISYAAILSGPDVTSSLSFQRTIDLSTGSETPKWCNIADSDVTECELPTSAIIEEYLGSSAKVTFRRSTNGDAFGVFGCRAERYNWTTESKTLFMHKNANFIPAQFTVTVSQDEEVLLSMTESSSAGSGTPVWKLNVQMDLTSTPVTGGYELYISKANGTYAGIHHCYYPNNEELGGLIRLIVRGCLDNIWGPSCQYTCPECYNGGLCDDASGRCVCPPGFSGDHCETACPVGYFGKDCNASCSSLDITNNNCVGAVFCLPDPYGCSCMTGWKGLECNEVCDAGTYGAGCTQTCHCLSDAPCNKTTGDCTHGCDNRWTGPQCQVKVLDLTGMNPRGGISSADGNLIAIYVAEGHDDPTITYYIGREVDTGPGNTGHGVTSHNQDWVDTGLPPGTTVETTSTSGVQRSLRAKLHVAAGGNERVGAFTTKTQIRGRTERTVMFNEFQEDGDVWPERYTTTTGIGEHAVLSVTLNSGVSMSSLRWRHNGGDVIVDWNGLTSVFFSDVRKSDEGIYECYVDRNRETGRHAIMRLIVRGCPFSKWGSTCSNNCQVCYAGGVCHDVTGECICRPGFKGNNCETACGDNWWSRECKIKCSTANPTCRNSLFSPPDPVGTSCITGFYGDRCDTECSGLKFGANCELNCNCGQGDCDIHTGCAAVACNTGFTGPYCQEMDSSQSCPSGYFGTLCTFPCHCQNDESCDRSTGECDTGSSCAEGWSGSDCQQALPRLLDMPWVEDTKYDSVVMMWNAWTDGYDYGNGPVDSYEVHYNWTDIEDNKGESQEPVFICGDSTANVTGLFGYRDYDFYVSVVREVEGQPVAGVRTAAVRAQTNCGPPVLAPNMSAVVNGIDSITINWKVPTPSSSWLQCESSPVSVNMTYWPMDNPNERTTIPFGSDQTTHTVDGLEPCTNYSFSVFIINSVQLSGPESRVVATTDRESPTMDFTRPDTTPISTAPSLPTPLPKKCENCTAVITALGILLFLACVYAVALTIVLIKNRQLISKLKRAGHHDVKPDTELGTTASAPTMYEELSVVSPSYDRIDSKQTYENQKVVDMKNQKLLVQSTPKDNEDYEELN